MEIVANSYNYSIILTIILQRCINMRNIMKNQSKLHELIIHKKHVAWQPNNIWNFL